MPNEKKRDICISQRLYNPLPFLDSSCLYSPADYFCAGGNARITCYTEELSPLFW